MDKTPIIDKCQGCKNTKDNHCIPYLYPEAKWRAGNCPMATHIVAEKKKVKKLNPLKEAKRLRKLGGVKEVINGHNPT